MGILEELLETNKALSEKISELSSEMTEIKTKIEIDQKDERLSLHFNDDDTLNATVTAKLLGITQKELSELIEKGLLQSIGERKRIFRAKDVMEFLKDIEESESTVGFKPAKKPVKRKKSRSAKKSIIKDDQIKELYRLNNT
jgi:hypothetical protein